MGGKAHQLATLAGQRHAHAVAVDDGPACAGSQRADWALQTAAGFAGAAAVVRRQELVAKACAACGDACQGSRAAAGALDEAPAAAVHVDAVGCGAVRAARQLQLDGVIAARGHDDQPAAMLGHAVVSGVQHHGRQCIAE